MKILQQFRQFLLIFRVLPLVKHTYFKNYFKIKREKIQFLFEPINEKIWRQASKIVKKKLYPAFY